MKVSSTYRGFKINIESIHDRRCVTWSIDYELDGVTYTYMSHLIDNVNNIDVLKPEYFTMMIDHCKNYIDFIYGKFDEFMELFDKDTIVPIYLILREYCKMKY